MLVPTRPLDLGAGGLTKCTGVADAGEIVHARQPALPSQRPAQRHDGPGQCADGDEREDDDRKAGAENRYAPVASRIPKLH